MVREADAEETFVFALAAELRFAVAVPAFLLGVLPQ
jgi:hypothetical protein